MFLRVYVVISSLALVILTTAAFRQAGQPQTFREITVERINVVDANGTLRLVISNKDRMHPGVMDCITIERPRPVAGIIGLTYSETNGQRTAGFQVWDRSDRPLSELIQQLNAANRIADPTEREAAVKKVRDAAPAGPRRVFVGKNADRAASVSLADAAGKPRLTLTVDASGNPRIEFLDENGKIVERIPQGGK